jgi:hypothetical protein
VLPSRGARCGVDQNAQAKTFPNEGRIDAPNGARPSLAALLLWGLTHRMRNLADKRIGS